MAQLGPQRYFLPSAVTCLAVAVLPAVLIGILIADMNSPSWDPNGDQGASIGVVVFTFESLVMVIYAALVFPLIGFWLQRKGQYGRVTFLIANIAGLVLASLGASALVSFVMFGNTSHYVVGLVLTLVVAAVFCLPFTFLWLWLAK